LSNYLIGVLLAQSLELFVTLNGLLDSRDLLAGNIAGDVFAMFACLELIKGTGSTFLDDGQLAPAPWIGSGRFAEGREAKNWSDSWEKYLRT